MTNFDKCAALVLTLEGGLTLNPADNGNWTGGKRGEGTLLGTKFGISAASFPNEDIRNLTKERALELYRAHYWDEIDADELPPALALIAFDCAVNQGAGWAKQWLTLTHDPLKYMALRLERYTSLKKLWPTFGRGWVVRCAYIMDAARRVQEPLTFKLYAADGSVQMTTYPAGTQIVTRYDPKTKTQHVRGENG